jgi:predicted TIM-barrel fold metal-dependent hydrolase
MTTFPLFDRRRFLKVSAGLSVATVTSNVWSAQAATMDQIPIVDTHQHLWDLKKFKLPWIGSEPGLARSYVTSDYLEAVAGLPVSKAVYMEVDVDPAQQVDEAEHLIALSRVKENLTVGAVISGRPASDGFAAYIRRYRDNSVIKGVRQVLHVPETKPGTCLQPEYVRGVRLLGELGKSFDLCMRPTELGDAAKLADACPGTRLILDHCGNADPKAFAKTPGAVGGKPSHEADAWRRDIQALSAKPNVICKISGIVVRAVKGHWSAADLAPIVNHCLDSFGPDRVIFGSDWPVCTLVASYREWVVALREIIRERPTAEQKKLLHENAERFYKV